MVREAQSKKVEEAGEEVVMKKARPRKRKEFSATLESLRRPQIASKFVRHTRRMAAKAMGIEGFATYVNLLFFGLGFDISASVRKTP
jgi:hypothetical protein